MPVPAGLLVREARLDGKLISLVPGSQGKGASHLAALLFTLRALAIGTRRRRPGHSFNGRRKPLASFYRVWSYTCFGCSFRGMEIDLRIGGGLMSKNPRAPAKPNGWLMTEGMKHCVHLAKKDRGSPHRVAFAVARYH